MLHTELTLTWQRARVERWPVLIDGKEEGVMLKAGRGSVEDLHQ